MKKERKSGIELAKIIAMFMIVVSHIIMSVYDTMELKFATNNYKIILLQTANTLFASGGNTIYFIASCWFLSKKKTNKKQKVLFIILDVWVISILWFIPCFAMGIKLNTKQIIKEIFPTLFANNWYITCYIIFYLMYPYLNIIINSINKSQYFNIALFMFLAYFFLSFFKGGLLFNNDTLTFFIPCYFIITYIERYKESFANNKKINVILLISSIAMQLLCILIVNKLGLKFSIFKDKPLYFNRNGNFLTLIFAISMFNLFKSYKKTNKIINEISSLSLLQYAIHENILFRSLIRPNVLNSIINKYGKEEILLIVLISSILLFVASGIIAFVYKHTIQKLSGKIASKVYEKAKIFKGKIFM